MSDDYDSEAGVAIATAAISTIGELGKAIISPINNAITSIQNVRLQEIQSKLRASELYHERRMQKIQNSHEEKMLEMRIKHEEFVITEQRKVIEKMIEAASAAYDKKIDFINAQLVSLENTYSKERDLLSDHIKFLETERVKCMNDVNQYTLLSTELSKLEDSKSKLYTEYMSAKGNLNDAVKYLEIDKSFGSSLENANHQLLGAGGNV